MKFRKILAVISAFTMTFISGIIPVGENLSLSDAVVSAASYTDGILYDDNSKLYYSFLMKVDAKLGLSIVDCDKSISSIDIPSEIDGCPVEVINYNAFSDCSQIENVTIPDTVNSIYRNAFSNCTSLKSIVIPDSVKVIDTDAFSGCVNLSDVKMGNGVNIIYKSSFSNTAILNDQTGVKYIGKWAVDCDNDVTSAEIKEGTIGIARNTFSGCSELKYISVPDSISEINDFAFSGCTGLSETAIPNSVKRIGEYAFYCCTGIEKMTIPESITHIDNNAFSDCINLESISIPESVVSIGEKVFNNCKNLKSVTMPDSLTSIGVCAFSGCESLECVTVPQNVKSAGRAFENCTGLKKVIFEAGAEIIDGEEFKNCTNLTDIETPESLKTISYRAFENTALLDNQPGIKYADKWVIGCDTDITEAEIKAGTTGIAHEAFYECKEIKDIKLPDSLKHIGDYAFSSCENISEIDIPDSVMTVGISAFYNTAILNSQRLNSKSGLRYVDKWLVHCDYDVKETPAEIAEIKEGTIGIASHAFENRYEGWSFKNIYIPDSLKYINERSLYIFGKNLKLETLTFGENITFIDKNAIDCSKLMSVTIKNPECEIYDDPSTIKNVNSKDADPSKLFTGTIFGYENSTAQAYAEKYGYKFESLGEYLPSVPEKPTLLGDTDGSGSINTADIVMLQKYLTKKDTLTNSANADINDDGKIDVFDSILLRRLILKNK